MRQSVWPAPGALEQGWGKGPGQTLGLVRVSSGVRSKILRPVVCVQWARSEVKVGELAAERQEGGPRLS